jgi:hypothetical protein
MDAVRRGTKQQDVAARLLGAIRRGVVAAAGADLRARAEQPAAQGAAMKDGGSIGATDTREAQETRHSPSPGTAFFNPKRSLALPS